MTDWFYVVNYRICSKCVRFFSLSNIYLSCKTTLLPFNIFISLSFFFIALTNVHFVNINKKTPSLSHFAKWQKNIVHLKNKSFDWIIFVSFFLGCRAGALYFIKYVFHNSPEMENKKINRFKFFDDSWIRIFFSSFLFLYRLIS